MTHTHGSGRDAEQDTGERHLSLPSLPGLLAAPIDAVTRALPDSPVPVALGAGALAVAGVIEWPVAGAIGLGYLALRRWR